ncbi:hypothetical protein MUO74_10005 [Candidatus Bathyarchaeota archaeon]|nr:hypothetical protein [Candidatus Bathyarchaeota archaeon]
MDRKRLLSMTFFSILIVALTITIIYYMRVQEVSRPSWLKSGSFMSYEQIITYNGESYNESMSWNVTRLSGDSLDLYTMSHSVNTTGGDVVITPAEGNWTVNAFTREILVSSNSYDIGQKIPYWIPTNVREGSAVDTMYGAGRISGSETVFIIDRQRDCWVLEYSWLSKSMIRWYDKSSGACLKVYIILTQLNVTVEITQTAVATNIDL